MKVYILIATYHFCGEAKKSKWICPVLYNTRNEAKASAYDILSKQTIWKNTKTYIKEVKV